MRVNTGPITILYLDFLFIRPNSVYRRKFVTIVNK